MRVLLIEDNRDLTGLIRDGLSRHGFAVDCAASAAAAQDAVAAADFDLVILDLGLPDGDGRDLLRDLRRAGRHQPVLIVTARSALGDRVAGLDAGADDYLIKPFAMDELLARVRALLRRPGVGLDVALFCGNLRLDSANRTVTVSGQPLDLGKREIELLTLLLRRQGKVVAKEAIESALYTFDEPVTPNAVEALISRVRRRLADAHADVGIHTLRGLGYLLRGDAQ